MKTFFFKQPRRLLYEGVKGLGFVTEIQKGDLHGLFIREHYKT